MDRAVFTAYGWHDLGETVRPEFLMEETEDDHTYQGPYSGRPTPATRSSPASSS
ncbi:hypothetical protein [Acuticoccus sp.]|uniref:hypothetical protein n=1 Tax=Acuticoccus sp. TaxID=1904378 RepID=UPI003B529302